MDHAARVYDSVLDMLPSEENPSPMVRINKLNPLQSQGFQLFAKLEWLNPFGSVKDRAAWEMIRDLEERQQLGAAKPNRGLVEPTSGNTGLSLAAIAAVRGYPMRAVVPSKVPPEKRMLLKLMGADLDVTSDAMCPLPGAEDGTIGLARTYAKASPDRYAMPNQYENQANIRAHIRTTGPEIWRQTAGKVTHVFTSLGTCGTVTGLSQFLKSKDPAIKVIAVQPSPGHDVPGIRNVSELDVSRLYDPKLIDEVIEVPFERAYDRVLDLCRTEGLMAGPSSGLIFEGAHQVLSRSIANPTASSNVQAASPNQPGVGVMIFCDSVLKYASSMLKHHPELVSNAENEA
jgi:cysteine synthase B